MVGKNSTCLLFPSVALRCRTGADEKSGTIVKKEVNDEGNWKKAFHNSPGSHSTRPVLFPTLNSPLT